MPRIEGLSCAVCFESYRLPDREPLVLVCGHTFCRSCVSRLKNHVSTHSHYEAPPSSFAYRFPHASAYLTCPTCRVRTDHQRISINYSLRDAISSASPDSSPVAPGRHRHGFTAEQAPPPPGPAYVENCPGLEEMIGRVLPAAGPRPQRQARSLSSDRARTPSGRDHAPPHLATGRAPTAPTTHRRSGAFMDRLRPSGRTPSIPPHMEGHYRQADYDGRAATSPERSEDPGRDSTRRAYTYQDPGRDSTRRAYNYQDDYEEGPQPMARRVQTDPTGVRPHAYGGEVPVDADLQEALRRSMLEAQCGDGRASADRAHTEPMSPTSRTTAAGTPQSMPSWGARSSESSQRGSAGGVPECTLPVPAVAPPTAEETSIDVDIIAFSEPSSASSSAEVVVTLQPPQGTSRAPSDICCIVDVSDSMGNEAVITQGDQRFSHGMTLLDVVKQSLKAVVRNLGDEDRLAVVAYAKSARVVLPLTPMCEEGRLVAELRLNDLRVDGLTNLWAGLQAGVELLEKGSTPGRLQHVLLLTDGVPSISPPRGEAAMLRRLHSKGKDGCLPCTVSTFGFGHDIDSGLLLELAAIGAGTYSFIPDAGVVGTVFVNAISNFLVTMATYARLRLEPLNGASFKGSGVLGGHAVVQADQESGAIEVDLGPCLFGQSRDLLLSMDVPDAAQGQYLKATLQYRTRQRGPPVECVAVGSALHATGWQQAGAPEVGRVQARATFVEGLQAAMDAMRLTNFDKMQGVGRPVQRVRQQIEELAGRISQMPGADSDPSTQALLADLRGDVSKAFSREDLYLTWGWHYLPSLVSAHVHQQCNNFKDSGVQCYGGQLFQEVRDGADDVFANLQADRPVRSARSPRRARPASATGSGSPSLDDRAATPCAPREDRPRRPAPATQRESGAAAAPAAHQSQSFIARLAVKLGLGCGRCSAPVVEESVEQSGCDFEPRDTDRSTATDDQVSRSMSVVAAGDGFAQ